MSPSPSRLTLRQLSCWLQVILLAWGMGSMVQPVSASQVLPRLETETVTDPEQGTTVTAYAYDAANNRASKTVQGGSEPGFWEHDYNEANQLVSWRKLAGPWGTLLKEATLGYDANGNRSEQRVTDVATLTAAVTQYSWDAQDRLSAVEMPDGQVHGYEYDYRTRRMGISRAGGQQGGVGMATAVVFSGGLSLAEWESTGNSEPGTENPPSVHYTRGPDMGGGVGGLLYSRRGTTLKYNLSNGRGDIVAQSDAAGALTWTASYEAYGKRTKETGENADKQRANTKDEDPTGLLNEGFRYRDLETGVWLSRDPAGFVDGPNLYAYVKQNPWTAFDAHGLFLSAIISKLDEHVFEPAAEAMGRAIGGAMSANTLNNLSNSKTFANTGTALNAAKSTSMTALNTLSPFDDAAREALNGNIQGALVEAGKEVAGGKFTKAGGKLLKTGGEVLSSFAKKGGNNLVASAQKNADEALQLADDAAKGADGGFTADLTKTNAKSRSGHSNAGNKQLNEATEADPTFRAEMEAKFGDDVVDRTSTSNGGRRNPRGAEWDHNTTDPNALDLRSVDNHRQKSRSEGQSGGGWKRFHKK